MNYECKAFRNVTKVEGRYPNYFNVGHNASESVIDCGQFYPEGEETELHTRIITSPVYAKFLLKNPQEVHQAA